MDGFGLTRKNRKAVERGFPPAMLNRRSWDLRFNSHDRAGVPKCHKDTTNAARTHLKRRRDIANLRKTRGFHVRCPLNISFTMHLSTDVSLWCASDGQVGGDFTALRFRLQIRVEEALISRNYAEGRRRDITLREEKYLRRRERGAEAEEEASTACLNSA